MRTVLVHNPGAGSGDHSKDALLLTLRRAGLSAHYCATNEEGIAGGLGRPSELIVVAGGDGTVAKVIAQLPDRSTPVAIVPLGVANNIARSMGIVGAPAALAAILRPERTRCLDIGSAQGPWGHRRFVEAVGLGPLAQAIRKEPDGESKLVDGSRQGRRALQDLLLSAEALDIEVTVDGEALPGDVLDLEIVNVAYTGPALPLAPHADSGDGKLDVVCMPVGRRQQMVSWLDAPHQGPPPVNACHGRRVVITGVFPHQRVDDDVYEPTSEPGTIMLELEHRAARIVVPPAELAQALRNQSGDHTP
jgi:diacylglycerol kinase family enzyme